MEIAPEQPAPEKIGGQAYSVYQKGCNGDLDPTHALLSWTLWTFNIYYVGRLEVYVPNRARRDRTLAESVARCTGAITAETMSVSIEQIGAKAMRGSEGES